MASNSMILGVEIGGTKLQLGVGDGESAKLLASQRCDVDPSRGAAGILQQIETVALTFKQRFDIQRMGIGFGGPVQSAQGRVIKSHQIAGWDDFPFTQWCQETLGLPAVLGNDCDCAALAEARFGAGQGSRTVFYMTIGTGIGGGFVIDGRLHGAGRPAVAEIGHLRPGLFADCPEMTVESLASGPGIASWARDRVTDSVSHSLQAIRRAPSPLGPEQIRRRLEAIEQTDKEFSAELLDRVSGDAQRLTAKIVAQAAAEGNELALDILSRAVQAIGWALAQTITLLAPDVVVVGGGVSLIGESFFYAPLRREIERYVFPPLANSFILTAPKLGEWVVVPGAIALAQRLEASA